MKLSVKEVTNMKGGVKMFDSVNLPDAAGGLYANEENASECSRR